MKKLILLASLAVSSSILLTACAANNAESAKSEENISQTATPLSIETQTGEYYNMPLPETENKPTGAVFFEEHETISGTDNDDQSIDKWMVPMEPDENNAAS